MEFCLAVCAFQPETGNECRHCWFIYIPEIYWTTTMFEKNQNKLNLEKIQLWKKKLYQVLSFRRTDPLLVTGEFTINVWIIRIL